MLAAVGSAYSPPPKRNVAGHTLSRLDPDTWIFAIINRIVTEPGYWIATALGCLVGARGEPCEATSNVLGLLMWAVIWRIVRVLLLYAWRST